MSESRDQNGGTVCGEAGGPIVYFDGSCALCRREIAIAKRLTADQNLAYVDISGRDGAEHLDCDLTVAEAMARFHVRRADGQVASGAAAFIEMWSAAPRLSWLRVLTRSPAMLSALDKIYNAFLKIRPRISKAVARLDASRVK
jgi:predicted DCC family thiol-disulfide oxidoreductase YuxK